MKATLKTFAIGAAVLSVLILGFGGIVSAQTAATAGDASASWNSVEKQVVAHERAGLDALKVGDLKKFGDLTADDAVLVDPHGPASKAQVLKNVTEFRLTDFAMDDIKLVKVAKNAELISYKLTEKGTSHGHEFAAKAYISSVWVKRGSDWRCLFSQETGTK